MRGSYLHLMLSHCWGHLNTALNNTSAKSLHVQSLYSGQIHFARSLKPMCIQKKVYRVYIMHWKAITMIWALHAGSNTERNLGRGLQETGAKQLVVKCCSSLTTISSLVLHLFLSFKVTLYCIYCIILIKLHNSSFAKPLINLYPVCGNCNGTENRKRFSNTTWKIKISEIKHTLIHEYIYIHLLKTGSSDNAIQDFLLT